MTSIRRIRLMAALMLGAVFALAAVACGQTAHTLEEAKALAAEYDAPIVIDFYADW